MKIRIDRKILAQAIAEVAPYAPSKPVVAVLKNAKFTTRGNRMKIEANDTQCSVAKYVETLECDQDGSFLMDMADFNKFISKIKGDEVEIEVEDNSVHVKHKNGTADFQTEDAKDFPEIKIPKDNVIEIQIGANILADAISKAKSFVANDKLRPIMTAIYAYVKDNEFGFCASDTHKLIHGYSAIDNAGDLDIHWIIIPTSFTAVLNACKSADLAKIQITEKHVSYFIGNTRIMTLQIQGNFPNFARVISKEWNMECSVDKGDFSDALSRISLFCDSTECIKMNVSNLDMAISVDNLDKMKKSTEHLMHNGCNGNIQIGVNVSHIQTCASIFNAGDVLLRMTDATRPILFTQQDNENVKAIVMPMALINQ